MKIIKIFIMESGSHNNNCNNPESIHTHHDKTFLIEKIFIIGKD